MKKRLMALFLAFALSLFAGCAQQQGNGQQSGGNLQHGGNSYKIADLLVWGASNTESIMADEEPRNVVPDLNMTAIKGETESGQFIITSKSDKTVSGYNVIAGDLKTADGDVIDSSNIEIFNQKYIKVSKNSWTKNNKRTAKMFSGYYPDALIPMDRAVAKRENKLTKDFNQGVWVNVNVPRDAAAGDYSGKVTVTLGAEKKDIPIKLKVYDLTMPTSVHAKSMYAIWYQLIEKGEGKNDLALQETYYDYLLTNRLNPTEVPILGYSNAKEYAEYIVKYAKDERVTNYRIPLTIRAKGNVYYAELSEVKEYLTAMAKKQQELRVSGDTSTDLFKKAFWYTIDEPDYTGHMDDIAPIEKVLIQAKNEVAAEYPEFADGIKKVAHIMVTQTIHTECAGGDADGGIQTWCAQLNAFDSKNEYSLGGKTLSAREFIASRRSNPNGKAAGEDIWWYHCNQPENPYPTAMIDDNLISMRLLTWMQYSLDISGVLYWCVNYYQKLTDKVTLRNLWEDPVTMGRSNGDGYLLYPGKDYGMDGPIGSLRVESMRESKEDYEYFWMLEQKVNEINSKHGTSFNARDIQTKYLLKLVKNDVIPVIDGKENVTFVNERNAFLDLLLKAYTNESAFISEAGAL